ncbi:MAG TPA: hypothetical protein VGF69_11095 [Thermoanaerobaculia bacterium]|jgi:hypothetical protein
MLLSFIALLYILGAPPPPPAVDPCEATEILRTYLTRKYPKEALKIVAFDHKEQTWTAWRWDGTSGALTGLQLPEFELPHTNKPTLYVRKSDNVAVLVLNTDPLLYSGKLTASTEAAAKDLTQLQEFAALFGGIAQGVVSGIDSPRELEALMGIAAANIPAAAAANAPLDTLFALQSVESAYEQLAPPRDPDKSLREGVFELSEALLPETTRLKTAHIRAKNAATALGTTLRQLEALHDGTVTQLQLIESGSSSATPVQSTAEQLRSDIVRDFGALAVARQDLAQLSPTCVEPLSALSQALTAVRDGKPANVSGREQRVLDEEWGELMKALARNTLRDTCDAALVSPIDKVAIWLRSHRPGAVPVAQVIDLIDVGRETADDYLVLSSKRGAALEAAAKLLEKRADPVRHATQLVLLAERQSTAFQTGDPICYLTSGITEIERVEGHDLRLPWSQVRTEEFTVTVIPTFKDALERRRPDETKGTYNFARFRQWKLDVDTALIYTDITDREFKAVEEKTNVDEDGDGEKDTLFRVKETKQDTRAGQLAMMLTLTPANVAGFGAQIGFGFDTDDTPIFAGLSWKPFDFIRLSAGRSWQKVTKLGNDTPLGAALGSADALQTRESFDSDWYYAIAFTVTDLPIFNRPAKE